MIFLFYLLICRVFSWEFPVGRDIADISLIEIKKNMIMSTQSFESFSKNFNQIAPPIFQKYYELSKQDMGSVELYSEKLIQEINRGLNFKRSLKKRELGQIFSTLSLLIKFTFLAYLIAIPFSLLTTRIRKWYCKKHPCIPRPEDAPAGTDPESLKDLDFDNLGQDDDSIRSSPYGNRFSGKVDQTPASPSNPST